MGLQSPTLEPGASAELIGRKSQDIQDIQAAGEIWSFFAAHGASSRHGGSAGPVLGR